MKEFLVMKQNTMLRRTMVLGGILSLPVIVFLSAPLPDAAADPAPAASSSASTPAPAVMSAALFAGTTKAPSEGAWKTAAELTGVRMGKEAIRHSCQVKHIAEWVRIHCDNLSTGRADLVAGEKRDLQFIKSDDRYITNGDSVDAQFSMHAGDRRVIQWTAPDLWWSVWQGDEGKMASGIVAIGVLFGLMVQVDWASGTEPTIAIY